MRKPAYFISILALIFGTLYLALAIWVGWYVHVDRVQPADAVLVLGAKSYRNGEYNPCLKARVEHGVDLIKAGKASRMIVSGGPDLEDDATEAEVMAQIATESGLDSSQILQEPQATSTYENLIYSKELMSQQKIDTVILVTEGFHMRRASLVAEDLDIKYTPSPTNQSPCWTRWKYFSRYFLREPLVILYYIITGKITIWQ